jgi:hypothetical protein
MASEVKTNKVSPSTGVTVTLGDASDVFQLPASAEIDIASGATLDVNGTIDVTGATTTGFPSSGFNKYTVVAATDTTFALQSGTTKLIIEVQASGGYAGNTDASVYRGGNGGGGAYARKLLSTMVDTDTLNITIGAVAAIAGSGNTTSVASASGTSFTTITCVGGAGGVSGSGAWGSGGAGGTLPTTGDFNFAGGSGSNGQDAISYMQSCGGSFYSLVNSRPVSAVTTGPPPLGYGGGGATANGASEAGGVGGAAVVIVWEFK